MLVFLNAVLIKHFSLIETRHRIIELYEDIMCYPTLNFLLREYSIFYKKFLHPEWPGDDVAI